MPRGRATRLAAAVQRGAGTALVAELGAPADDVRLELRPQLGIHRGLLVALERRLPDRGGALGAVAAAVALPALEVLRAREQRPVEAVSEARERVLCAEEMAAMADLLVCAVGEARLVHLERRELLAQRAHDLEVDDELLEAGDEARLQPAGGVHDEVRAGQERRQ